MASGNSESRPAPPPSGSPSGPSPDDPAVVLTPAKAARLTHPPGLSTLFFTEMWERFSYYGMRALLVLFMVEAVRDGGMGWSDERATAIYGLYTAAVYLAALPGGWMADRLLGAQRAVWIGGLVIAAGHFVLAVPRTDAFFLGLVLVVVGTGLLKPNISALVADLYPEGGARRDAGFTIFYMGINLGAAMGPLVCGALGEKVNWHWGFAAAGVGMLIGLAQFRFLRGRLGDAGRAPGHPEPIGPRLRMSLIAAGIGGVLVIALGLGGWLRFDPVGLARGATVVIVAVAAIYFACVLLFFGLNAAERRRVGVIIVLFLAAALFWAGFEQAGSSFNLFAERHTERVLPWVGEIPASWFQSLGPVFIIALAPAVASAWVALARRNLNPPLPVKFGLGLVLLGIGFLVMSGAAALIVEGGRAMPLWLVSTYLIHTVGELCLSPVGLSSVTKLAPRRLVGQMMGTWFLAASLGSLIAGLLAGRLGTESVDRMPGSYFAMALIPIAAGILLVLVTRPIARWAGDVR